MKAMSAKKNSKEIKPITNRIYVPYPIEVFLKIISWVAVIVIDTIDVILMPFMRMGIRCFGLFAAAAALASGYSYFRYDLIAREALLFFAALLIAYLAFLCTIRLIKCILTKAIRPPFEDIIFAPVCVSFRRPAFLIRKHNRRLLKQQMKGSNTEENGNQQNIKCKDALVVV